MTPAQRRHHGERKGNVPRRPRGGESRFPVGRDLSVGVTSARAKNCLTRLRRAIVAGDVRPAFGHQGPVGGTRPVRGEARPRPPSDVPRPDGADRRPHRRAKRELVDCDLRRASPAAWLPVSRTIPRKLLLALAGHSVATADASLICRGATARRNALRLVPGSVAASAQSLNLVNERPCFAKQLAERLAFRDRFASVKPALQGVFVALRRP